MDNTGGWTCPYCGQFVTNGESHYCFTPYFIPMSQEVVTLREILEELRVIENLLRELK